MISDFRFVVRSLFRSPGFTAMTVLTLALGMGAAAAIYSVVETVLFRTNNYPDGLVVVGYTDKQGQFVPIRIDAEVQAFRQYEQLFAETAAAYAQSVNVVQGDAVVGSNVLGLSANLLPMLGVGPRWGRNFNPGEDVAGRNNVLIARYEFAVQHFLSAEGAIGQRLTVGEQICTIVGVLPPDTFAPAYFYSDLYQPLAYRVEPATPWLPYLYFVGKLRPGVTRPQAEAVLATAKINLPPALAPFFADRKPTLWTMWDVQKLMRPEIYRTLLGAVSFLFGIACLNATNLMLVRSLGRTRELNIRLSVGGGRWQIVRLLLMESVVLATGSAVLGAVVGNWFVPLFMALASADTHFTLMHWSLNWRAWLVLGGLSVITALATTIVPAWNVFRINVVDGLKSGGAAQGESRKIGRIRSVLVVLQAAVAVVLLIGAGLMVQTFVRLQKVPLGFSVEHRVKVQLGFPSGYVAGNAQRLALLKSLREHLQGVPGVASVAYGTDPLLPGYFFATNPVQLADGTSINVATDMVSAEFLEVAGIKLKRGRLANSSAGTEIMINEALARVRFPNQDPVGQFIKPVNAQSGWNGWLVVGVVSDVRDSLRSTPGFRIYGSENWSPSNMTTFIVRTVGEPDAAMMGLLKQSIYRFDPRLVTAVITSFRELRERQMGYERFALSTLNVLSSIALVFTIVGLFSVLSYAVGRRMSEFGVRLALGATPRDLARQVVGQGFALVGIGSLCGAAGAIALTRFIQSVLFETPAFEVRVLAGTAVLMLVAGGLACAWPAWRASRTNVSTLLRAE